MRVILSVKDIPTDPLPHAFDAAFRALMTWDSLKHAVRELRGLQSVRVEGAETGALGFIAAEFLNAARADKKRARIIAVVNDERDALELHNNLLFAAKMLNGGAAGNAADIAVFRVPWWGTYRPVPRGSGIFGERASSLARLASGNAGSAGNADAPAQQVFIVPQRAFQAPLPPPAYINSLSFSLKAGGTIDTQVLAERLVFLGYIRVPRVSVRGEFALRGEVLDIFLPSCEHARRVVFDFDTIEKIRAFDTDTQSTLPPDSADAQSLLICPMKEVVWEADFTAALNAYAASFGADDSPQPSEESKKNFVRMVSELEYAGESEGEELFYPLLFPTTTLIDYLADDDAVFFADYDRLENAQEILKKEYRGLYERERAFRPVLPPGRVLLDFGELARQCPHSVRFGSLARGDSEENLVALRMDPPRGFFGNVNYLKETLEGLLINGWRVIITAESQNQALRIAEIFKPRAETDELAPDRPPPKAAAKAAPKRTSADPSLMIVPESLSNGFGIPEHKLLFITENEIFGRRKRVSKSFTHVKSAAIDTFVELAPGDFIVHVNYGIGLFEGIERVKTTATERDYIKLKYADDETVFIPIEQANLVQRYIGNEGNAPRLDTLGSKSWENRKNRVKKAVEDIAARLIDLYSRRKASRGFPFPKDTEWQAAFEAEFPWEETPDQLSIAEEVKRDMEAPAPMDRLICGDVGYGKTEIALRAAFKAVMGGKQAALLAPTTLLAEQHYETCLERFERFPVKIAHLSRMVPRAEQVKILENLARGEIDLIVGTHRIIQKDARYKDLGLMIVDEEQRFGVKDKERLKELKTNIDCLALSATPIPRTLHMSLLKIRDMSLLTTPPRNRQAIDTVIEAYSGERVALAIREEAARGGQVFFLHNRIETLEETRLELSRLVPEMLIGTAHGQMSTRELDDVFRRFKLGGYHVLVATTIIENGIDIPNVNTIIIDRADMYGVSQLYQLRGRVGRSDRKARAFLLYPENRALSEIAMRRLQVISDFTELGSGFKIAMKDMEIRGAGNLLGRDQSGDVYSVGFDLYLRLLEEAVARLSDEHYAAETEVLMELEYTGFIPDSFINNPQIKMEIYKKIASLASREEIAGMEAELLDRFGALPAEVLSLLSLAEIRVLCKRLAVHTIQERGGTARIEFGEVSRISVEKAARLIGESGGKITIDPRHPNVLIVQSSGVALSEKSEFLREKLEFLCSGG